MKNHRTIVYSPAYFLATLFVAPAFAQQAQGDVELQINANSAVTTSDVETSGSGSVNLFVGYYITRLLQIHGGIGVGLATLPSCTVIDATGPVPTCDEAKGSELVFNPTLTAGVTFHFSGEGQKTVPYLGLDYARIGVHGGPELKMDGNTIVEEYPLHWTNNVRANGGIKFFLQRNIAFDFNIGWDKDLDDEAEDVNTFDMRFGFSYVF